jgi:hypothetical protein
MKRFLIFLAAFIFIGCTPKNSENVTYIVVPKDSIAIIVPKEDLMEEPYRHQMDSEKFLRDMEKLYPPQKLNN